MNAINFTTLHGSALKKCEEMLNDHIQKTKQLIELLQQIKEIQENPRKKSTITRKIPKRFRAWIDSLKAQDIDTLDLMKSKAQDELRELSRLKDNLEKGKYINRSEFSDSLHYIIDLYSKKLEELK